MKRNRRSIEEIGTELTDLRREWRYVKEKHDSGARMDSYDYEAYDSLPTQIAELEQELRERSGRGLARKRMTVAEARRSTRRNPDELYRKVTR